MNATIVLTAAIQGFLIATGLLSKRIHNRPPLVYLGILVLVLSIEMLFSWGGTTGFNNHPDTFPYWLIRSYLIIPPALWLFFRHHENPAFKFNMSQLWYFIPALVDVLISSVAYLSRGRFLSPGQSYLWVALIDWLPLLLTISVLVWYTNKWLLRVTDERQRLNSQNLKIITVLIVFWLLSAIWFMESVLRINLHVVFQTLTVAMLFVLAYVAYFKPGFLESPPPSLQKRSAEFSNFNDETELVRLTNLFKNDRIFKQPRLTLTQVGNSLNLPAKYISYLVNQYRNCNFNDFVNGYRVAEVIRLIPLEPHKTLAGIATDAGFSSRSTFQQVFKQQTGKPPSAYLPDKSEIMISHI
ncbi:helix-turn-helix domain-containing protein [Pedobacter sp. SYP-B3415]|uniref:AraC family transcriptional regulator n=1 Tax=Pedobacter sp. SYP-B3415 TaxID=2496641 RepID=UPI00101D3698|nr:helix-turn-helix domain-containing protein [Pedobacter sp. SYP-B3415]